MDKPSEDRDAYAVAMEWVTRITTIAMEMVVPIAVGYWADKRLGTKVLFTILGLILGFASGMWHLLKLAKKDTK